MIMKDYMPLYLNNDVLLHYIIVDIIINVEIECGI